jgi:D-psicose/D-tagatose/L-ribulose 3-epimerase
LKAGETPSSGLYKTIDRIGLSPLAVYKKLLGGFLMKYGIVYAYWSKDWEGEYIPTIKRAAKCGFDVLEIFTPRLLTLSKSQLDEIKSAAQDNGIELTYLVGLGKEQDLSSENDSVRKNGIEYISRILDTVHYLGGTCFSGINFCAWCNFDGVINKPLRWEKSVTSMKEIAKKAEAYGISYNLEITNRFEQFLLNTSKEAVEYVNQVGSPNVNILLDAFHMMIEEDSMYDALVHAGNKLGHVHVGENNRKNPHGKGFMPWNDIAKALKEIGYDKRITLEPLVLTGGTVATDSRIWRDMTGNADDAKMDADAKAGLEFMKELMKK